MRRTDSNPAAPIRPSAAGGSSAAASGPGLARRGFSLIELLVVIVIIGILVGLLVPGVMTAYRRSQEFAIEQEVNQLSLAIEAFKTKYGFYPPDFTRITDVNQFIPYLNRIAPNHSESANLTTWWTQVGSKLNAAGPQSSYVFWLSGLAKNKQYPLTGNTGNPLPAYNVGTVEREVFFDFKSERLYYPLDLPSSPAGPYPTTMTTVITVQNPNRLVGELIKNSYSPMIATYSQFSGNCQPFVFFELKSLTVLPAPSFVNTSNALYNLAPYNNGSEFFNKDKFQLIAPGMDSLFSATSTNNPNIGNCNPRERDNITNFSEGRLERTISQ
jgi:prepilin-type N-terminal cleavage/methylation domain-containing protein